MAIPVGSALGYVLGERVAKSGLGPWGAGVLGTGHLRRDTELAPNRLPAFPAAGPAPARPS